jgi:hypothetical protein
MSTWNYQYASKSKQVRRTFFSFHYQLDVTRAHVVRNSWVTKEDREEAGFFDASVFESKQRAGDETLKRFLNEALDGTSVTAVLIGIQTAFRPWVRYELVRSFQRGKGLFGIRIHNIKNFDQQNAAAGSNPFDLLAYQVVNDRVQWQEKNNESWSGYDKVPTMALSDVAYDLKGEHHHTFASRFSVYDWVNGNGYENLGTWVERAAQQAGK